MSDLLFGCYTPDRGRGTGIAGTSGTTTPAVSPSFVIRHPRLPVIYAVAETEDGGVAAWSLNDWAPMGLGGTGGADPCHLTVSGEFLVTVNYSGGSVAVHALDPDGRIGTRTDLVAHQRHGSGERQSAAHPHMVRAFDDGLVVTDLGGDAVYLYHLDAGKLVCDRIVHTPAGSGPRHSLPVGDRWLVTGELSAAVLVYDTAWNLLGEVAASRSSAENLLSELAASDGYLYVANRGPDTISVFALDGELPVYLTEVPTGRNPRHIALNGDLLHVANQDSDEVITLRIDPATGIPARVGTLAVPSATCVLVL
jgi:6-phosphogluconolactonase